MECLQKMIAQLNRLYQNTGLTPDSTEAEVLDFMEGVDEAPPQELGEPILNHINQAISNGLSEQITTAVNTAVAAAIEGQGEEGTVVNMEAVTTAITEALKPVNKLIADNHQAALKAVNDAKLKPTGQGGGNNPPAGEEEEVDTDENTRTVKFDDLAGAGEIVGIL